MNVLEVNKLHKHYPIKKGRFVCAVNGIDFSIGGGETLGLVGESGCGKTTVGKCISGLIKPTEGDITLLGQKLTELKAEDLRKLRNRIQVVFQDPYGSLNPRKVVHKIVEDPLVLEAKHNGYKNGKLDKNRRLQKVKKVLAMVGLSEEYLEKYPVQLTQGEQQRVGVARAFVTDPQLVILDEPTSLLDIRYRGEIIYLLKRIQEEIKVSYLFISHDLVVISQLSHRIAVMYLGRIVEEGPTEMVFGSPLHPYTRALFAAALMPDPEQKRDEFLLKGEVPSPVNLSDDQCNLAPRCPMAEDFCLKRLPELEEVEKNHFVACFKTSSTYALGGIGRSDKNKVQF